MLRALQFLWLLPATILVWLFYILPLWALGCIRYIGQKETIIAKFQLVNQGSWYARRWKDWWGWSGPCVLILRRDIEEQSLLDWHKTILHELEHCYQQFRWGVFHYPAYLSASVFIYFFEKEKHSYFDNPFERNARKAAGQPVEVDKKYWDYGTTEEDRWAWW
jgi:hypothetical protein